MNASSHDPMGEEPITGSNEQRSLRWLGKLTRLNPASGRPPCYGKAPHKPLLLLTILDMVEDGEFLARTFARTGGMVLRFRSYGSIVADRWPTRLDLRMPFYYLKSQGFWTRRRCVQPVHLNDVRCARWIPIISRFWSVPISG